MPGKQEIEFVIRPDGTVEERVIGVDGPECLRITEDIEKALGTVQKREHTSEFYNSSQTNTDTVSTSS